MTMVSLPLAPASLPSEDFVNLYALLKAEPDAPADQLRARISALYLEAQRNLDHHNFRKRFYYQQLFEVHLPQAYESLLEPPRRAYYDACLAAYQQGEPFPPAPAPCNGDIALPALGNDAFSESRPVSVQEPKAEPQSSFPRSEEAALVESAHEAPATQVLTPQALTPDSTPHSTASPQTELERRRDYKRRELIESEVHSASWAWGSVGGAAVIGASLIGLAVGVPRLQHAWLNSLSTSALWLDGLLLCVVLAGMAFVATARLVRRMVVHDLSRLPYEELLRRCSQ